MSVRRLIENGGYRNGDRLPSIAEMARRFGVAHPTLREALRKLETLGIVRIRHGSGVYVREQRDPFLVLNPAYAGEVTRELLLDVLDARLLIELRAVWLAAREASDAALERMSRALASAGERSAGDVEQAGSNVEFHREIAAASGNAVLMQLLDVLSVAIDEEQRILESARQERFRREHEEILDALRRREADLAVERMRVHLESVRAVLQTTDPDTDGE